MFLKPFKIKSNVQLKGSEGKKLRAKIQLDYPAVNDSDLSILVPNKSTITQVKLIIHAGNNCSVYAIDKRPMFFEDEQEKLLPTIYALWLVPTLVPYFTTLPAVLPRLGNGADLMLPGVIRQGTGLGSYGHYKKDEVVAVNLTTNKAAVGVGKLARSSDDLYMAGGQGPCVKMLHVFGDKLWSIEPSVALQIPPCDAVMGIPKDEDFPALGAPAKKKTAVNENKENINAEVMEKNILETVERLELDAERDVGNTNGGEEAEDIPGGDMEDETVSMDTVLHNAFMTALKMDGKNLALPLLTSNFYRLHVLPAAERQIDLKQTTYKKFSKFLTEMIDKGFLVVREESKGVEKIVSIDFEHPDLVNFIPKVTSNNADDPKAQLFHATMTELYTVTDETIPFFTKLNYKKGDGIPTPEIKKILKQYISKNQLPYAGNTKQIQLDPTLREICGGQESAIFGDVYQTMLSRMNYTYAMRGKNEVSSNKPPIQMTLATRSGNKKVTLVSNLESYGIIISEFAKACKVGAAASTTVVKSPHQKMEQLQVQGNQVRFIHNLLTETYKIPPKQIQGLDLAKKEKKKK